MCLKLVVDTVQYMVQLWIFHDGFLHRDAFGQIEILMDDGSTQFFWWVIQPDQDNLCMRYFLTEKKFIWSVFWI
jgi:hypothetical protein